VTPQAGEWLPRNLGVGGALQATPGAASSSPPRVVARFRLFQRNPLFKGESPNPRPIVDDFRRQQQIHGRAIGPSIAWSRRPLSEGEQGLVIVAQQLFGAEAKAAQTCSVGIQMVPTVQTKFRNGVRESRRKAPPAERRRGSALGINRRRIIKYLSMGLVVTLTLVGMYYYAFVQSYQSTDDAFIEG
jgi:hypothetical protein